MEKIYKGEIQRLMPIFQAMSDGRIIQVSENGNDWIDIDGEEEGLFIDTLIDNPQCYRIKPEPKYRQFLNAEEFWTEMLKHQPFGWIKPKGDDTISKFMLIDSLMDEVVTVRTNIRFNYQELLEYYTFADRTPLGILEED